MGEFFHNPTNLAVHANKNEDYLNIQVSFSSIYSHNSNNYQLINKITIQVVSTNRIRSKYGQLTKETLQRSFQRKPVPLTSLEALEEEVRQLRRKVYLSLIFSLLIVILQRAKQYKEEKTRNMELLPNTVKAVM